MAFSSWIRSWKHSLERRWALYQALRRKAVVRRLATRPRLEALEDRWLLSTYVVNTTADSGTGSLRDAITQANNTTSGITEIDFNIGTKGTNSGVQIISPASALPALTASSVFINGYSENQWQGVTSTSPLIELNGASVSSNGGGLGLDGNNNTVSGLIITRFTYGILVGGEGGDVIGGTTAGAGNVLSGNINAGVLLDSDRSGDAVEGNYIGTNVTGTERGGNDDGILVLGNNNTIGGSVLGARNVISGNNAAGVNIDGGTGTLIEGNYIGVDATGTISVYNAQGGIFDGGENNTIGGTSTAARNVISGNTRDGVDDLDNAAEQVFGNYIGTDATGTKAIPNSLAGIEVSSDFGGVTIGGTAAGAGNVISGNLSAGVLIDFANSGIQVQGNYIGTDATGAKALANSLGIQVGGAVGTIGGTSSGARNIISGNTTDGVLLNASFVTVQGNYIGTDVTGTQALANGIGVYASASNDTISGSVISGNSTDGVFISSNVTGVQVQGNYIGTDATGAKALGNSIGVSVNNKDNTIGGTASGARNIISGNTTDGVFVNVSAVSVQGNYIGTDVTGSNAVGNSNGIEVHVSNNLIGDTVAAAGNVISGNTNDGVLIDSNVTGVDVYGNFIGTDVTGAKAVGNHTGVEVAGSNNRIGFASTQIRNIISGNSGDGVLIDAGVRDVAMQGNYIGTNASGSAALANSIGIAVSGSNNTIGGRNSAALNLISGNSNDGMLLDSGSSGNQVQGNYMGANAAGSTAVANEIGIEDGGSSNILGGSVSGARNIISGNSGDGVLIDSTATKETMQGNYIGTDTSGNTALANGTNGVEVKGSGNSIGGNSGANHFTRNFISGNKGDGVLIDSGATGNGVLGNFIGIDVSGTIGLANSVGIEIGGNSNTIGGTANGVGDVISGNSGDGVLLDSTATGNLLQGNYVGTDNTGRGPLANSASGIEIQGVGNTVGAGNVLSGNSADGVRLDSLATGNLVLGSLIGLNLSGAGSNGGNGINILGNGNTVGGTVTAARNMGVQLLLGWEIGVSVW